MVGRGLAVAVIELDKEGEGLLVVLLGLWPLALRLRDRAQIMVGRGFPQAPLLFWVFQELGKEG